MTYKNVLIWLVGFGRVKSTIITFFIIEITLFLIQCLIATVQYLLSQDPYLQILSGQIIFSWTNLIFVVFGCLYFYNDAKKTIEQIEALEARGLTLKDVKRIEFIKNWEAIRKDGVKRFCLYSGGILAGIVLAIPVALIYFLAVNSVGKLFPTFTHMLSFIGLTIVIGYIIGVIVYYIRWKYNERKFIRLTDPLC